MDKEKMKKLEKIKADLATKYKKNVVVTADTIKMKRVPTGLKSMDIALGGGLPLGRFLMYYAPKSCGKTSLCYHHIATIQKTGGIAALIDAEFSFDAKYAGSFGVDVEKLLLVQPNTLEESTTCVQKFVQVADLVVVDSIVAVGTEQESNREIEQDTMAAIPRKLSQFFRMVTSAVGKSNATVILINQTRAKLDSYIPIDSYPGGNALAHAMSFIMHIRRGSPKDDPKKIVNGKEVLAGIRLYTTIEKTKLAGNEKQKGFIDLLKDTPHFDPYTDLLQMIQLYGIITRAGAWYYYKDKKFQGENGVLEAMHNDEEMFKTLNKDLDNKIAGIEEKIEKPTKETKKKGKKK